MLHPSLPGLVAFCVFLLHLTWIRPVSSARASRDETLDHEEYLKPIRPEDIHPKLFVQRDAGDLSILDPLESESFIFGNPADDKPKFDYANMTIYATGEQRILSPERFGSALESLECGKEIVFTFASEQAFNYATKTWEWVNHREEHRFFFISDHSTCADADERQPYILTTAESNADTLALHLTGEKKEWTDVTGDMDLDTGTAENQRILNKRWLWGHDFEPTDVSNDFKGRILNEEPIFLTLDCLECHFEGIIEVTFSGKFRYHVPERADLFFEPKGLYADVLLRVEAHESMGAWAYLKLKELVEPIPVPGLSAKIPIPKIKGAFGGGLMITPMFFACLWGIQSNGTMNFGATGRVADDSRIRFDLLKLLDGPPPPVDDPKGFWDLLNPLPDGTIDKMKYRLDAEFKTPDADFEDGQAHASLGFLLDIGCDLMLGPLKFGFGAFWNTMKWEINFDFANLDKQEDESDCKKKGTEGMSWTFKAGSDILGRLGFGGNPEDVMSLLITWEDLKAFFENLLETLEKPFKGPRGLDGDIASMQGIAGGAMRMNRGRRFLQRRAAKDHNAKLPGGEEATRKYWTDLLPMTVSLAMKLADWLENIKAGCEPWDSSSIEGKSVACKVIDNVKTRECANTSEKCPENGLLAKDSIARFDCQADGEVVDGHAAWGKVTQKNPRINKWASLKFVDPTCQATILKCPPPPKFDVNKKVPCFSEGKWGDCMNKDKCKAEGRIAMQGHPDNDGMWPCNNRDADEWCCANEAVTHPPPDDGNPCNVNGRGGHCIDELACVRKHMDPLPGPVNPKTKERTCGPKKNVMCCADPPKPPSPPPAPCKVGSKGGKCVRKHVCLGQKRKELIPDDPKTGEVSCNPDENVLCCGDRLEKPGPTPPPPPPPPPQPRGPPCDVDGRKGDCILEEDCLKQGKDPLPGNFSPAIQEYDACKNQKLMCCAKPLAKSIQPPLPCFALQKKGTCLRKHICVEKGMDPMKEDNVTPNPPEKNCRPSENILCCIPKFDWSQLGKPQPPPPPPPPPPPGCNVNGRKGVCIEEQKCFEQKKDPLPGKWDPKAKRWPCGPKENVLCCADKLH